MCSSHAEQSCSSFSRHWASPESCNARCPHPGQSLSIFFTSHWYVGSLSCWYAAGGVQHQGWWVPEQSDLVGGNPVHGTRFGTKWSLRSLPPQAILWFYGSVLLSRLNRQCIRMYVQDKQTSVPSYSKGTKTIWHQQTHATVQVKQTSKWNHYFSHWGNRIFPRRRYFITRV